MEGPDGNRRKMLILSLCLVVVTLGSGFLIPISRFLLVNVGAGGW